MLTVAIQFLITYFYDLPPYSTVFWHYKQCRSDRVLDQIMATLHAKVRQQVKKVRSYKAFKQTLIGIFTPSKRKSLVTIAKIVGLKNSQSLHNFLTQSPWKVEKLRAERLKIILKWLNGEAIDIIIDETGEPKREIKLNM